MYLRVSLSGFAAVLAGCVVSEYAPYADDVGSSGDDSSSSDDDASTSSSSSSSPESTGEPDDEPALPPYDGEPLPASPIGQWQWVDFPDAFCRDGTPTGIGVRRGLSPNLIVFFEGGGACFNGFTCLANPHHYDAADFLGWGGHSGIFADHNPDNPVADWTAIYIPYCSGDVHAGDHSGVVIPDAPGEQQFAGYTNVDAFLRRIVPTFGDAPEVLVTGVSAGGFGAGFNYHRIARIFAHARVTLLDDSGPVMRDKYLAPCLQQQWRDVWDLGATLPAPCDECFAADGGGIHHIVDFLGRRHPNQRMGYISSERDATISIFYSFGLDECVGLGAIYPSGTFLEGLYDFRESVLRPLGNAGSYYIPSTDHTWISGSRFYSTEVAGVLLTDWVADLLAGEVAHISPTGG